MKMNNLSIISGILLLVLLAGCQPLPTSDSVDVNYTERYVQRVIDGDTFVTATGEHVRLICINTPERGEPGYDEATNALSDLIWHKVVYLEKDVSEVDRYGRWLRYVYVKAGNTTIDVNKYLVAEGYAEVKRYKPDVKHCDEYDDVS